jgi:hypothetical protein
MPTCSQDHSLMEPLSMQQCSYTHSLPRVRSYRRAKHPISSRPSPNSSAQSPRLPSPPAKPRFLTPLKSTNLPGSWPPCTLQTSTCSKTATNTVRFPPSKPSLVFQKMLRNSNMPQQLIPSPARLARMETSQSTRTVFSTSLTFDRSSTDSVTLHLLMISLVRLFQVLESLSTTALEMLQLQL